MEPHRWEPLRLRSMVGAAWSRLHCARVASTTIRYRGWPISSSDQRRGGDSTRYDLLVLTSRVRLVRGQGREGPNLGRFGKDLLE